MNSEEIERAIATTYAHTFATDTVVECLLMAHPNPTALAALIEKRLADKGAVAALEVLRVGDREEQLLSEALKQAWDHWLLQAKRLRLRA